MGEETRQVVAIDRLTGKPYAYRDDSEAGMTGELTAEDTIELEVFTESELKAAKQLRVLPETLRGGG